ncbi:beta-1,4-glucuronyltransferase 1-like [Limulus polyphemus]|uniref:Beta-1,4-glucuronyltransferase 1 n=1 Tax=Limulus polyphemus TaxID=6850 RepID=A0ABM1SG37_LIMPO|nr:beta-1,4-glucuronyltransferase 1-like [Limulus polyphemus]XP_022242592.1 beta-1,4-glucuronyltransferase 1-like [Limulus polyphemus]
MAVMWRRAVVLLVLVIAVLQIIHMTLLSRLEARKNGQQRTRTHHNWDDSGKDYQEFEIQEDRAQMLKTIQQSSVLDSSGEFRIVNFLIHAEFSHQGSQVKQDVSIVTQATVNHLHYLSTISERWHGPISVVVFSLTQDIPRTVEGILHLRQCFPAVRYNTSFHLVYPLNNPQPESSLLPQFNVLQFGTCEDLLEKLKAVNIAENYAHGVPYPNNLLRNVGRRNALTEFIFVIDIDLVPSDHLHEDFQVFAKENRLFLESHKDDKTVYVVPAFELKEGAAIPKQKTELLQLLELMEARPFYFELCWKCQKHTDYEAWQREPPTSKLAVLFEVLWRDPWEPFYIARNSVPLYDERFRQYGFNRISQVCEQHVAGYKFSVLNNAFVIHEGLKTPSSFHKDKDMDQERNRILFRHFKAELKDKYPDSSRRCY